MTRPTGPPSLYELTGDARTLAVWGHARRIAGKRERADPGYEAAEVAASVVLAFLDAGSPWDFDIPGAVAKCRPIRLERDAAWSDPLYAIERAKVEPLTSEWNTDLAAAAFDLGVIAGRRQGVHELRELVEAMPDGDFRRTVMAIVRRVIYGA